MGHRRRSTDGPRHRGGQSARALASRTARRPWRSRQARRRESQPEKHGQHQQSRQWEWNHTGILAKHREQQHPRDRVMTTRKNVARACRTVTGRDKAGQSTSGRTGPTERCASSLGVPPLHPNRGGTDERHISTHSLSNGRVPPPPRFIWVPM